MIQKKLQCPFGNNDSPIASFGRLQLRFQRTPYTPAGLLALTDEHRSSVSIEDLKSFIELASALPDRVGWWSGPRSGGTQNHTHFQLHQRRYLGGSLPIEQSTRRPLLHIDSVRVSGIYGYALPGISVSTGDNVDLAIQVIHACISELHGPHNLVLPSSAEMMIIPRTREIPHGWMKKFGGAEVAGVIIYSQEPQSMPSHASIWQAIENVGLSREEHERWEQRILQRLSGSTCRYGSAETADFFKAENT